MVRPTIPWTLVLLSLLAVAAPAVRAQDAAGIKWRLNYNEAKKESEAKNLPMLIDFITVPCFHCDRMDKQTFADPRNISLINQKFIPLKVNNSNEESKLVSFLQINMFPTVVLASPGGEILQKKVGFQEADQLHELMQQTLANLAPTDAMQEKYQKAVQWEETGKYLQAIANLRDILADAKPRPIKKNAEDLLRKIEKHGADRLARAKELEGKGQNAAALEAYGDVARNFPGTPPAREAMDLQARLARADEEAPRLERKKRARDLLTQAREFYKGKDYLPCWDRCEIILGTFGDLPEAQEAYALRNEIGNNRDWLQGAANIMFDRLGTLWLLQADLELKQGEVQHAKDTLQRVISTFPGSRLAESAQIRLNQLQATVPIAGNRPQ